MKYLVLIFAVSVMLSCSKEEDTEDTCTCVSAAYTGEGANHPYYEEYEFTVELEDDESCSDHNVAHTAGQGPTIKCTLD